MLILFSMLLKIIWSKGKQPPDYCNKIDALRVLYTASQPSSHVFAIVGAIANALLCFAIVQ